jgi:hypothetical protein
MAKDIPTGTMIPTTLNVDDADIQRGATINVDQKIPRIGKISIKKNAHGQIEMTLSN